MTEQNKQTCHKLWTNFIQIIENLYDIYQNFPKKLKKGKKKAKKRLLR